MKKNIIYLTLISLMMVTAYTKGNNAPVDGLDVANLDTTAIPGNDFYQYAAGGWMTSHPLQPEYSRYGTFDAMGEKSKEQVQELIDSIAKNDNAQGSIAQKIGDLYSLSLDSVRRNQEGNTPLLPYLTQINGLKNKKDLAALLAQLSRSGTPAFFYDGIGADDKNSSLNIYQIVQGGLSLGDRDYYLQKDAKMQSIRTKFVETIEKLFTLAGYTPAEGKKASVAVLKIETRLAQAAYPREKRRDPEANYHKISTAELTKIAPALDWTTYFKGIGIPEIKELNLGQIEPMAEVNKIIQTTDLQSIKYYLLWKTIASSANALSDDFAETHFDLFGRTLSGKEAQAPRWKRAVNAVNGNIGEGVGRLYVEKYFPPTAKEKMLVLVKNLQTALGERIQNLPWMSDVTKVKAQEKLAAFHVKVGYPDKWRDYSGLTIDKKKSYLDNLIAASNFTHNYEMNKWNKPVDKDEWYMTPQTVNAYYDPSTNSINFPAAILQPPFFNVDADDAVNYGAIGVVIGHEMSHGFDDQGRQFDKDGNLKDWWTPEDAEKFKERAQVLVDVFDNIIVIDSLHANGRFTLGENIGDQGGLQVSWQAYQNTLKGKAAPTPIDGFTGAQRFFLGYATVWAGNIRPEAILQLTKTDPHALGRWRVNGALPQIDAWYDAFNVTPEHTMYVPKEKRVAIW
ncbi:MAG: M13 family metallopeptidase [Candidatus Symbiothrix sp.]|jgi:putative endopeptidase|nr:M13 family metallopeptidase [Candidatus Symbiothrix sp.]